MGEGILTRRGNGIQPSKSLYYLANESNMSAIASSGSLTSPFVYIGAAVDDDYVYALANNGIIYKLHSGNLGSTGVNTAAISNLKDITSDDDFIYTADYTTVYKFHKANLFTAAQGSSGLGTWSWIVASTDSNNPYIYLAPRDISGSNYKVRGFHKSNLTLAFDSPYLGFQSGASFYGGCFSGLIADDEFIYTTGRQSYTGNDKWWKIHQSNGVVELNIGYTATYGQYRYMGMSADYFVVGDRNFGVYHKSNGVLARTMNDTITGLTNGIGGAAAFQRNIDPNYVYVGGQRVDGMYVRKLDPATGTIAATSSFIAGGNFIGRNAIDKSVYYKDFLYFFSNNNGYRYVRKDWARQIIADDPEGRLTYEDITYIKEDLI